MSASFLMTLSRAGFLTLAPGKPRLSVSHGIGWKLFSLLAVALTAVSDVYQSLSDRPIVKTLSSKASGCGSVPGGQAKIPHASRPKEPQTNHKTEALL